MCLIRLVCWDFIYVRETGNLQWIKGDTVSLVREIESTTCDWIEGDWIGIKSWKISLVGKFME